MTVADTLTALGGVATWAALRQHHSARAVRRAAGGEIVRLTRGRYAVPSVVEHPREAARLGGALSHLSAALSYGWKVKTSPDAAHVTVARKRRVRAEHAVGVALHHADLDEADLDVSTLAQAESPGPGVARTSALRTVMDCARALPFDEALTVADSALRARAVSQAQLAAAAAKARGPGSAAVRRVAAFADARSAGPLESVLRALAIECGLRLTPQLAIAEPGIYAIADLGDPLLRLVLEAEGYQTHGTRSGLRRDCRRHTEFAVIGWTSLRYAYEDVMFEQDWVRWTLMTWLCTRAGLPTPAAPRRRKFAA
ncbi:MAG: hypothetical protein KBB39_07125 [Phycicoccus sp.]|nr:hypothetical protein [Phycicoccus sp.]